MLARTGTGTGVNTAYIERLNATFRGCRAGSVRRGRALLRQEGRLQAGLYLVGCVYNWCRAHDSLRTPGGGRTPAMAAGRTDPRWDLEELLSERVVPAAWKAPGRSRAGGGARRRHRGPLRHDHGWLWRYRRDTVRPSEF